MLSNYDAKAIAEVMGLAFAQQAEQRFALDVDGDILLVVDVTAIQGPAFQPEARGEPSSTSIERAVSSGLPRQALRHVAETIAGADPAWVSALEWEVVPKSTLERRKSRLSVGESERTERIARLFVHARRALGTDDEARAFMTTPHPELGARSPLAVTATDLGTRRAEQILQALEYGLAL